MCECYLDGMMSLLQNIDLLLNLQRKILKQDMSDLFRNTVGLYPTYDSNHYFLVCFSSWIQINTD